MKLNLFPFIIIRATERIQQQFLVLRMAMSRIQVIYGILEIYELYYAFVC